MKKADLWRRRRRRRPFETHSFSASPPALSPVVSFYARRVTRYNIAQLAIYTVGQEEEAGLLGATFLPSFPSSSLARVERNCYGS